MDQISIWGIKINPLTKAEIIDLIDNHIRQSGNLFHLTGVNPETIAKSNSDEKLREAINDSDVVNIDNMMVTTMLRFLGYKIPERVACPDIFESLLSLSNSNGYRVYFLGAKQEVLDQMIQKIKTKYPQLIIAGERNGYFKSEEEENVVNEIKKAEADLLFIGLPTPQKELFIKNYKLRLGAKFAFGVGGAFDVVAGKVVRAPKWMQRIGLEGFHRIAQNPSDYGKRALIYYKPFFRLFLGELFNKRYKSN
jgi:N-acetylglucosaminyldiphosphoundecaprenol N-acetyl-beta-D-mannosaminyltransferase